MRRAVRAAVAAGALVLAAGPLAGCGIRATAVPIDAGAAPTRVVCQLPSPAPARAGDPQLEVRIYLVCGRRLVAVHRLVAASPVPGLGMVRLLLGQLSRSPSRTERGVGFSSAVPSGLAAPGGGTVAGATSAPSPLVWRLNRAPAALPPFALGQVVCTLADSWVGGSGGSVVLAGPSGVPHAYTCDAALRTQPDAGASAGTPAG